jgi:FkbM family methyltransferase
MRHKALRLLEMVGAHKVALMLQAGEPELGLLRLLVDPKRTAIDIGAADGLYSLHLQRIARSCVAFEPNPASFRKLCRIFPDLDVRQIAASSSSGEAGLRVPVVNGIAYDGWGTIDCRNNLSEVAHHSVRSTAVRTARLDDLNLDNVGFVKIDVEGHEVDVLAGAVNIIKRDRPNFLIEVGGYERNCNPGAVFQALDGYISLVLDHGTLKSIAPEMIMTTRNVILLPRK